VHPRVMGEIRDFEHRVVPKVDRIRAAHSAGKADQSFAEFDELRSIIGDFTGLMPEGQIQATVADLTAWADSGFDEKLTFDATRDSVPAPRDGQPAAFIGPVILPNGDSKGTNLEAFAVIRQDADCTSQLQARYPHP
jgi:hypothetical protein